MLGDPPLVEKATATSSGRACAMSWRVKIASVPMSLAMAVMLAGSAESDTAGMGFMPYGGAAQSATRSFASVAEPPWPRGGGRCVAGLRGERSRREGFHAIRRVRAVGDQVVRVRRRAAVAEGDDLAA